MAITLERLTKQFGDRTVVRGVDLEVGDGTVHALLGPNGSGKTTTVRMLATLLTPTSGRARVDGYDVVHERGLVRGRVGLVGQSHAIDRRLTGRQNLEVMAGLAGHRGTDARAEVADLLERHGLAEAADLSVGAYSGGMRRRLDILAGTLVRPSVLFLDEPTTGLDPHSRNEIFDLVTGFARAGTTVLLTTQYLDEAHRLADAITILDHGSVVADGSPADILATVPTRLDVTIADPAGLPAARRELGRLGGDAGSDTGDVVEPDGALLTTTWHNPPDLALVLRALAACGIEARSIQLHEPTLDDAFLAITGERSAA